MNQTLAGSERMSAEAFAALGVQGIAYVRRLVETPPGESTPRAIYAIFAADGERIGTAPDRDLAFAAIRQHELEPRDAM
jgi:hypothetical protein